MIAGAAAYAVRLVPTLRGGGLTGIGNYDDGVYVSAGFALAHGLLPYRDFLFLHPPGIALATWPYGIAAGLLGDPTALAAARLTWMLIGAVNCVLVGRIVWPHGRTAAALGCLYYAASGAALYTEWTVQLVAPAQTCVLLAILLLGRQPGSRRSLDVVAVGAGVLLGASATFKIWGVAAVAAALIWLVFRRQWRSSLMLLSGAAVAVITICLPFFAAAPRQMWTMVVLAQLGRPAIGPSVVTRLAGIVGLNLTQPRISSITAPLVLILILVAVVLSAAGTLSQARLSITMAAALSTVVVISPSYFLHYPGLVAGPLAVSLAFGASRILRLLETADRRRSALRLVVSVALAVPVAGAAAQSRGLSLGMPFPAGDFVSTVDRTDGCVAADDPILLIGMDVLTRNLDRGCAFMADLGGYSYVFAVEQGQLLARPLDDRWQATYLDQLRSGQYALAWRYPRTEALSDATVQVVNSWEAVRDVDGFTLRRVTQPNR